MKSEQAKVIRSLLVSATLSLLHIPASDASEVNSAHNGDDDAGRLLPDHARGQRIDKNVCKIMRDGTTKLIAAHRSHSSHRSHRSSSGGNYSRSSSRAKSKGARPSALYSQSPVTQYALGERALGQGMRGTDVDRLAAYLVRFYYLHDEDVAEEGCVYDARMIEAVRHFQRDAGYVPDGKFTGAMAEVLMQWEPERTTIPLGFRSLAVSAKMAGHDVDVLIELLAAAGCAPDSTRLQKQGRHYVFTHDVLTALKVFQARNGLNPTGELDSATVKKLNHYRK